MILIATLVLIALLGGAVHWGRPRLPAPRDLPSGTARAAERFAAVEIVWRGGACDAARAVAGQRFLADQSPALPLAGCTKARCDCRFAKLSDRRTEQRRWEYERLTMAMFTTARRRKLSDGRDTD
jgi:hypothetical protein